MPFIVQKDESVGKNLVQMLRSRKELCPETVLQYVKNSKGEEKNMIPILTVMFTEKS